MRIFAYRKSASRVESLNANVEKGLPVWGGIRGGPSNFRSQKHACYTFHIKVHVLIIYNTARVGVFWCVSHSLCHVCKSANKHTVRRVLTPSEMTACVCNRG